MAGALGRVAGNTYVLPRRIGFTLGSQRVSVHREPTYLRGQRCTAGHLQFGSQGKAGSHNAFS
jgi:hypothetical protein